VTISGTGNVTLAQGTGLGTSVSTPGAIDAGRVAILNLNSGGFLQTSNIVLGAVQSPVGYLNLNGGTLKAQVSTANYLAGLTRATMYSGGLTLDDNSASITVGQALLAPTGTGVVSIVVSGPRITLERHTSRSRAAIPPYRRRPLRVGMEAARLVLSR